MIVISGTINIDPASVDEAVAAIVPLMNATQAEDGCIDYVLSLDPAQVGLIRIFEKWENEEALSAHMRSTHLANFQESMATLGVTGMSVERFDGATITKLF
ncbi:MAG: antibiotic biosynthesis monooxygenase [Acidimicrobiaceae bacterium]|jgi:quinol monooxygenase YgiN|nr:antibiotic biosynthesis monooxygenase [Acidimicrobiaceae bacterium]MDP7258204.1 putative quinol monooxygenase [Acidimicrobiales bacterium]HCV36028.1 antibiotic biosynthesis monooxygenase [Acidimicrobiaceae bacterium]HJO79093.1 putative quinol monooxygenase [Acidimicrobiales bacterium]|tara:strand:+ start:2836 stop:3138 length:303 start_codon:yes stop_codon:yes gene_type:complete